MNEFSCDFGNIITLNVKHKFAGQQRNLSSMKAHDMRRLARFFSTVDIDIPLGGDGHPSGAGLYFAKLVIGNPAEEYHVQVDTGSDILWLNCVGCDKCPKESSLGVQQKLYDPKKSSSSKLVYCGDEFCSAAHDGKLENCKNDRQCEYYIVYGDGTGNGGYFVRDTIQLQQVTGNLQTAPTNGTIVFGCGSKRSGDLSTSSEAVNGIIGFGQANSSVISQLAADGKVKNKFAHCLDNVDGGGIFAIGEVIAPHINKTRMIRKQSHYKITTKAVEIGDTIIELETSFFGSADENAAIIDSGTTLSYLPTKIHTQVVEKITSGKSLEMEKVSNQFSCFKYEKNVDDEFPVIKFHFKGSFVLTVYPHDYLFKYRDDMRCIGWQDNGSKEDEEDIIILGDFVLSNKLVIYDIENQTIGWTEYNCSSFVKVKDEKAGTEYMVGPHIVSSASSFTVQAILILLSIFIYLMHFPIA
ncbi:aspartic proteinase 39-like [Hibiscus syriacus]|uniref:aspartic proteinase 39-like n=1 Tax=Hibiscus syriacus TaxID=106335 RepID=UPI0019241F1E|nr:aspartic proteinase 39-like [Hibiscus syriacus]